MNEVPKGPEDIKQQAAEFERHGPFSLERKAVESVAVRRTLGITVEHFSHRDIPDEKRLKARNRRKRLPLEEKSQLTAL